MSKDNIKFDFDRKLRTGLEEAIFSENKDVSDIVNALEKIKKREKSVLLTRLSKEKFLSIPKKIQKIIDFDFISQTAFFNHSIKIISKFKIGIVSAGTSDLYVAMEASRTLQYYGIQPKHFKDVGVAGLWRLLDVLDQIKEMDLVIAIAGMDAALPTVLGGLVKKPIICVPTSVGYGVAKNGEVALNSILASCTSGLVVTNIDNGFGAACAAIRVFNLLQDVSG